MADQELRELQRAHEVAPDDQAALQAYLRALRSAGRPTELELLALRVHPPSERFDLAIPAQVTYEDLDGVEHVRWLPDPDGGLGLPARRRWRGWAAPRGEAELEALASGVSASGLPALRLDAGEVLELGALKGLGHLEQLDLSYARHQRPGRVVFDPLRALTGLAHFGLEAFTLAPVHLAEALPHLSSLAFRRCTASRGVMRAIASLGGLRRLALEPWDATLERSSVLAELASLEDLEELSLGSWLGLEPSLLAPHGARLRRLRLDGCGLDDAALTALVGAVPNLEVLEVREPFEVAGQAALDGLAGLPLRALGLDAAGATRFDGLPASLRALRLRADALDADALTGLERFEDLEALDLDGLAPCAPEGLAPLGKLKRLRRLRLAFHEPTPWPFSSVDWLASLTGLTDLEVDGSFADAFLIAAAGLPRLRRLTLRALSFTSARSGELGPSDAAVAALAGHPCLETLEVAHFYRLAEAGLNAVAQIPGLVRFAGRDLGAFGPAGLRTLARSPSLRDLELVHCPGVGEEGPAPFAGLTRLRRLRLHDCGLFFAAAAELGRLLPGGLLQIG